MIKTKPTIILLVLLVLVVVAIFIPVKTSNGYSCDGGTWRLDLIKGETIEAAKKKETESGEHVLCLQMLPTRYRLYVL